ncbi:thiamine pyrophosphate-binding protein [Verminephrobacter aporrectodeae]|uniref:thiamine pyrophosphate-binding protein n=1 Tax=Verminephrobacter aporrectodeae TaxID=1110389 RepID=UPI00389A5E00
MAQRRTVLTSTSTPASARRNGGQILMQQLRIHGARRVFLVPGESYLPCIDAFNEHQGAIEPIVCRQESGAAYMAEAYGKLTGEPGICFVTRGPGATNASIGVHTAFQDSTPMILFIGQVGNGFCEREAFQEIDYRRMFGQMAKWVAQIDRTERIPEYVARAFSVATSGRPGPVVLALPEDTLWGSAEVADLPRYTRACSHPGGADLARMAALLEEAERPLMIVGGTGWTSEAMHQLEDFAVRFQVPVGTAWRRLECFDQRSPNAAGHVGWAMTPALRQRVRAADLIIAVGTRLGEATTEGYTVIESPMPRQKLVHVYPDPGELGRVFAPTQAIVADVASFAGALAALAPARPPQRKARVEAAHAEYLASLVPLSAQGPLSLDAVAAIAADQLPHDACITVGAGNYALYPHRYRRYTGPGTSLAPTVGSMGYGLPAAISAKLEQPERTVVCYAGDGCFQMNLQELGVALQYRVGVVVLVFNNGIWGTIRAHQEREFPGRAIALSFTNPDFAALVRSYGGHGEVVECTEDFAAALARACAFADREKLPALVELRYAADGIAPGETLSGIRSAALARQQISGAAHGTFAEAVPQPCGVSVAVTDPVNDRADARR